MADYPVTQAIEIERSGANHNGPWMTLWFNQAQKRNPLTDEASAELKSVFKILRDDRSVRGVTLRGRGGVFCSGGDLKSFKEVFQNTAKSGSSRAEIMAMSRGAADLFDGFNSLPQVTISLIEGAAVAGGFGLACCSDYVICDAAAKFSMTETMIGLSPAQIAPFVIQRLGYARARRLMLTGARFTGAEAKDLGLADFTAATLDELNAHEETLRAQVLRCAPGAVADTKALLIALTELPRDVAVEAAAENFAGRMLSDEAKEGLTSFFEKRKPHWAEI